MFTEVNNERRADWAQHAVAAYAQITRSQHEDTETQIRDLLTDLCHLADRKGLDIEEMFARSLDMYVEETYDGPDTEPDCGPKCVLDGEGKTNFLAEFERVADFKSFLECHADAPHTAHQHYPSDDIEAKWRFLCHLRA